MDAAESPETVDVPTKQLARLRRWGRRFSIWFPVVFAVLIVGARIDGYQMHVVRSGSMSPTLHVGDVTIGRTVAASSIKRGDIVTFHKPAAHNIRITHRVLRLCPKGDRLEVVTRGDANQGWETWGVPRDSSVESTPYSIPYLGRVVTDRWVGLGFGLVLVALAAWLAIAMIRGAYRRREAMHAQLLDMPPRLHRMNWLATGWVAFGAAVLMVTTPAYSAWTATDTNAQTLNSRNPFNPADYSSCGNSATTVTLHGYTSVTATVQGGNGGTGTSSTSAGGAGGNGAKIIVTFTVVDGTVLDIYVGCAGSNGGATTNGYATGGSGGGSAKGGSGGGASSIVCTTTAGNCPSSTTGTLVVAAGGGGGGGGGTAVSSAGGAGGNGYNGSSSGTTVYQGVDGAHGSGFTGGGAQGLKAGTTVGLANGGNGTTSAGGGGGGGGGYATAVAGGGTAGGGSDGGGGAGGGTTYYRSAQGVTLSSAPVANSNAGAGTIHLVLS